MKQFLKRIVNCNYFLKDYIYRIFAWSYNKEMIAFTKEAAKIDSIREFEEFAKLMKKVPNQKFNSVYNIKRVFSENTLYGYAVQLIYYAGCDIKDLIYLPIVEHGIPYDEDFDPTVHSKKVSYIFQGRYAESKWNSTRQRRKAYYIGPYIYYCKGYYSEKKIKRMKNINRKTALIFLPHTCEGEDEKIDIYGILNKYEKYFESDVKTVLACVYCYDTNKIDLNNEYRYNIKFVSAGFKTDPLFVRRLKTILELSDVVVFDSFSSSIGYAYYLGKEIICNISEKQIQKAYDSGKMEEGEKLTVLRELFSFANKGTDDERREFINKYWGLSEIKSKQEIRMILEENKKTIIRRMGF